MKAIVATIVLVGLIAAVLAPPPLTIAGLVLLGAGLRMRARAAPPDAHALGAN